MAKLTYQQKLDALSYRFYQGGQWTPKAGDFYTTSRADLELYQIVSVEGGVVRTRFTEGSDAISEWPEAGFLTDGFGPRRVFVPAWVICAPPTTTPQAVDDVDVRAAIELGASVLARIEDAAIREVAIRNALTEAVKTTPSAKPPGWPDPLKSAQAEAIRAGKLDDTEILSLFDRMEREIRVHRKTFCSSPSQTHTPAPQAEAWHPIKKAIWDKIIAAEVNGESYINAWSLTDAIYDAVCKAIYPPTAPHLRLNLKPLEWDKQHQTHYANSLFGNYSIWEAGSVFYLRSPGEHAGRVVGTTLEEAKGAALRDIEERILAAIVPAPRQPFAAMTVDYLGCEFMSRDVAQIERIAKGGSKGPTPVTYLFDAPPAPQVTGIRTVAELPMAAFADAAPQRDEFNGEQTILTYSANVGTWDLAFFASGEEFPEKWFGDTHWIDISCMWPGVIAQVASFADAEGSDNDA